MESINIEQEKNSLPPHNPLTHKNRVLFNFKTKLQEAVDYVDDNHKLSFCLYANIYTANLYGNVCVDKPECQCNKKKECHKKVLTPTNEKKYYN